MVSTAQTLKRILIYVLLFFAGEFLCGVCLDLLFRFIQFPYHDLYFIVRSIFYLLATIFLFWLYTHKGLHRTLSDFGIRFAPKVWHLVLAVLLSGCIAIVYALIGEVHMANFPANITILLLLSSLTTALRAGILEEMLFRGFILKLVAQRWGNVVAVLVPSFLFSLLHLPSLATFNLINILQLIISGTLVGVMFSLLTLRTGSITASAIVHTIWNFVMVTDVLHITTPANAWGEPLITILLPSDNPLLSGGGFGVEASLLAIIGYACVCLLVLCSKKRS